MAGKKHIVYLDNNSTTKPHAEVAEVMKSTALSLYGNASSSHVGGRQARKVIDDSRALIARRLGVKPEGVIFTAGATESNNLLLSGFMERHGGKGVVLTTRIEHPSITQPLKHLAKASRGAIKVVWLPVDREGFVRMDKVREAMTQHRGRVKLVAVIYGNNEIGTIQDFGALRRAVGKDVHIHADTTQVAGKDLIRDQRFMNSFTLSGHKIHGVKGVGALVIRDDVHCISPLMYGGGQEGGMRPGTESPPLIASLAKAVDMNMSPAGRRKWRGVRALRDAAREELEALGAVFNGPADPARRMDNIVSFSLPGTDAREVVKKLSRSGICANVGSACSRGKRSKVLQAIGVPREVEAGTIRIGFSVYNTAADVRRLMECLKKMH
eukprot:jgi/Mesvir1/13720/Mv05693-RA.1